MYKILIVDDDLDQQASIFSYAVEARWKNFEIFLAASETAASDLIKHHKFDAATCDIYLTKLPVNPVGFDIMRQLKVVFPQCRILCVTTGSDDDGKLGAQAVRCGAATLISAKQEDWPERLVYELKVARSLAAPLMTGENP